MIEKGRKLGLEKASRICEVCHEGIETEIHFIFLCLELDTGKRENLFSGELSPMYQNFNKLEVQNKLLSL